MSATCVTHTRPAAPHPGALCCLALLLALALALPAAAADHADFDRWYIVKMQDQRAGWMNLAQRTRNGHIESRSAISIEIKRGPLAIEVSFEAEFVETLQNRPVRMTSTTTTANIPTTQRFRFTDEHIEMTTVQGTQTRASTLPHPEGVWLTPAGAAEYIRRRIQAGAEEISVRTIDPLSGVEPVVSTRRLVERTEIEALGKVVPALKWSITLDEYPGMESVEYTDLSGVPIRTRTMLGGIAVDLVLARREQAEAGVEPPELLESTLVAPDRPIRSPRRTVRARYLISVSQGALPDFPDSPAQRFERIDESTARLTIDLRSAPNHDATPPDPARYLAPSAMIDSTDDKIVQLTRNALRAAPQDPAQRAETLRRFVFRYIDNKTLDVGFASASEAARARAGDCTEHAVLLAAMLRADGIPARVASGLIYADHFAGRRAVFGYHMWTQALIETDGATRWVDLDATLPPAYPTDATHILVATSDLADGRAGNALVNIAPLLGRLQISVEHTQ